MSLRIWLPMTKDLRNQGLDDVTVTNNGATFNSAGKLGGCYNFGTGASSLSLPKSFFTSFTGDFSIACWVKIITWNSSYATIWAATSTSASWQNIMAGLFRYGSQSKILFCIGNDSSSTQSNCITTEDIQLNTWYHFACTYTSGKIRLYQNGELVSSYNTSIVPKFSSTQYFNIGKMRENTYQTNSSINDFRLYDHCLSPMEVKELAKGLVLHYPLNHMGLGPSNLLYNGFGEFGTENWSNPSNIYDEVPPGHPEIKKSFGNNTSLEYIPVIKGHTYKVSGWIKAVSATATGYVYPSILDYDRDKVQIWNQHCKAGFNLNTMTTLTQQLKAGDTKIYVDSLANWNANSGHYYNYAAIFGYKNSKGYVYPDGVYTQNVPSFGSGTNAKTNLDKTNNIITLNSAYSGPTIPVGTKVCASAAGATYFYPWGAVNLATISDWTYKEGTFSTDTALRMSPADYMRFFIYSGNTRIAGITITDMTIQENESNIEYDCSGFCNNGTRTGTFEWTSNTPKYNVSTKFSANIIKDTTFNFTSNTWTAAFWYYFDTAPSAYQGFLCLSRNAGSDADKKFAAMPNSSYIWFKFENTSLTVSSLKTKAWTHIVMTFDGTSGKVYENGVLKGTTSAVSSIYTDCDDFVIGARANAINATATTCQLVGDMSDVRIYATALSASDVKSLYQNCATIDPNGTIRGQIRS